MYTSLMLGDLEVATTGWSVTGAGDHLTAVSDGSDSSYVANTSTNTLEIRHALDPFLARAQSIEYVGVRHRNATLAPSAVFLDHSTLGSCGNIPSGGASLAWYESDFTAARPGGGDWTRDDFAAGMYFSTRFARSSGVNCQLYEIRVKVIALLPSGGLAHIIVDQ